MRCAIPGSDDLVEFRYQKGKWFSDQGKVVEIRFYGTIFSDDDPAALDVVRVDPPLADAARIN